MSVDSPVPFREQLLTLDDRRTELGVPVALAHASGDRFDVLPALHLTRQDVPRSSNGWNHVCPVAACQATFIAQPDAPPQVRQ